MHREKYNLEILEKTLSLIRRDDPNSLCEALRDTCYLVEQGIKKYIHDKNPLFPPFALCCMLFAFSLWENERTIANVR